MKRFILFVFLLFFLSQGAHSEDHKNWEQRWVRISTNMLVADRVKEANELIERAAAAGYNGVVYADAKSATFFHPDFELSKWEKNAC